MLLWLAPQVLEHALLPKPFHVIPIVHLPMSDRIVDAIRLLLHRLISHEVVEVFDPAARLA